MVLMIHTALRWLGPGRLLAAGTVLLGAGTTLFSRSEHAWQRKNMMAANYRHIGGRENRLGRHYSRFSVPGPAPPIAAQSLARQKSRNGGSNRRSWVSLALNGASAAGFTVGPVLVVLSQRIGVGNTVPLTALALLTVVLPAIWFGLRGPPQPSFPPTESDSTVFIDWRIPGTWRFWSLALPFSLALSAQVGLMVHLVSLLLPHIGADGAATGLAATSIAAMSGRLALATVVDRLPQRLASAVSFTTQAGALSLIFLFPNQAAALYAGCIVFGLSVGNVITFPALIVLQEFPACTFGPVIGLNTAVCQFSFALAPAFLGIIRDVTGGYSAVLLVCIALELGAAVVILGVRFANTSAA